jgi:hypothetical protein
MWKPLVKLVAISKAMGVENIAISSNGSMPFKLYKALHEAGVNDFSISLDACCGSNGEMMAGNKSIDWEDIPDTIRELSSMTYVTAGVVLTDENAGELHKIVEYAHHLGVADIRIIPAAQCGKMIEGVEQIPQWILDCHPILAYRVKNLKEGRPVRSIQENDTDRCYLPLDDSCVSGNYHFPCVIYMREGGEPIGRVGSEMRVDRCTWVMRHVTHRDPICRENCLDVCVEHNNKCAAIRNHKNIGSML